MATWIPTSPHGQDIPQKWTQCGSIAGDYPGVKDADAFVAYMKKCQVDTTFYFADVNNKTVQQTLRALQAQAAVARSSRKTRDCRQRSFKSVSQNSCRSSDRRPRRYPGMSIRVGRRISPPECTGPHAETNRVSEKGPPPNEQT